MHQNKEMAILVGLCSTLAACDRAPADLTQPETTTSPAATTATQSTSMLATSNIWATKRALSPWRMSMAAGTINGIIYVVGGRGREGATFTRVDAYNVSTNTWSQVASLPSARANPNGASVINGKLYVTGGSNRDGNWVRTLFVYDPGTNGWSRKADMPRASCGGDQGVIGGRLYVYTGCFAADNMGAVFFRYNPATNVWVTLKKPPVDHSAGGGGVINGRFYLTNGFTTCTSCGQPGIITSHNELDVYNPATNTWTTGPGTSLRNTTAAVLNGKLYLAGGFGETYSATVQAYDPIANMWATKAPLPSPSALGAAAAAGGRLYYIEGGSDLATGPSKVYAYTP